jgi:hypothetical protein
MSFGFHHRASRLADANCLTVKSLTVAVVDRSI